MLRWEEPLFVRREFWSPHANSSTITVRVSGPAVKISPGQRVRPGPGTRPSLSRGFGNIQRLVFSGCRYSPSPPTLVVCGEHKPSRSTRQLHNGAGPALSVVRWACALEVSWAQRRGLWLVGRRPRPNPGQGLHRKQARVREAGLRIPAALLHRARPKASLVAAAAGRSPHILGRAQGLADLMASVHSKQKKGDFPPTSVCVFISNTDETFFLGCFPTFSVTTENFLYRCPYGVVLSYLQDREPGKEAACFKF